MTILLTIVSVVFFIFSFAFVVLKFFGYKFPWVGEDKNEPPIP